MRISLNQAAQLLLKRGAGIEENHHHPRKIGDALDRFFGGMSKKDADAIDEALEWSRKIDAKYWR